MKPSYKFLEHTADALFLAEAENLSQLFEQCGLAVEEVMINLSEVEHKEELTITGDDKNIEHLLFDFLDDLVFYKDSEQLIFNKFECKVEKKEDKYFLTCVAHGEKINSEKHEQKVDIKAITMHMFKVEETDDGWKAKVLVDI
jgi:SHS2 domain-containing protein